jgi:hypothetical protein
MAVTLAQLRSKVRLRYARSRSSNDIRDSLLDVYINYSLREVYNTVGDNAWFLRKTGLITVNGPRTATELPPNMKRLYRLEVESQAPGYDISWTLLRYGDDNALVILAMFTGEVTAHFLDIPVDLVIDTDEMTLPDEHIELAVVLACKRMAESVGNVAFTRSLTADLPALWKAMKRDCLRYGNQRHEGMRSTYYTAHSSLPN